VQNELNGCSRESTTDGSANIAWCGGAFDQPELTAHYHVG
jgi:hypothetical protein